MREFKKDLVPKPRDSRTFYYPSMPLFIEIGCGVGLSPIQFSQANPNKYLVAIERTQEKFEKFERRYDTHGKPENLYPVFGDAVPWITHNILENSVSGYLILYPNPYPKAKHKNKNFFNMPFFSYLVNTLVSGGSIVLATNSKDYIESSLDSLKAYEELAVISFKQIPFCFNGRTHFERKYLTRKEPCWNVVIKKN